jgi:hypothetical protein
VRAPQVSLPKLRMPQLQTPEVRLPRLPQAKLPRLPQAKLPRLPEIKRPSLPTLDVDSQAWRIASLALAVIAVVFVFAQFQSNSAQLNPQLAEDATPAAEEAAPAPAAEESGSAASLESGAASAGGAAADGGGKVSEDSQLVRGSTFSLALPAGWERVDGGGAAFAAAAADGGADAQLWISQDPDLDFPTFINNSLQQLEALAGSAQIVERRPGPTPETTVVKLAADSPEGQPTYEVLLRVAGPYRYYLATSVQPGASTEAIEGTELIEGSFTPEVGG